MIFVLKSQVELDPTFSLFYSSLVFYSLLILIKILAIILISSSPSIPFLSPNDRDPTQIDFLLSDFRDEIGHPMSFLSIYQSYLDLDIIIININS